MSDPMDSLESRLERLTPGQRREVEDFVEFLLQQSGAGPVANNPVPQVPPSLFGVAPPPLTPEEPTGTPKVPGASVHDPIHASGSPDHIIEDSPVLITEIATDDDCIAHDYMDYGQFDQSSRQPSPADEAVKNVRVKMSRKDTEDRTHQLLDWID